MDRGVHALLDQQIVNSLDILVFSSVCRSQNRTDTDGVFVDQIHALFRVNYIAFVRAVDVALLDIEVTCGLLPAHLHGRVHDHVGVAKVFSSGLALVLPPLLHGERTALLSDVFSIDLQPLTST